LTTVYNKRLSSRPAGDTTTNQDSEQERALSSRLANINEFDTPKKSLGNGSGAPRKAAGSIQNGIEGCIGGTPLIKIKSLSDYTGCEILAKAEVWLSHHSTRRG